MGSSISSTSVDRRTSALRRSQRKSLTGACSNIDKVLKAIRSFKGTEDSEEYKKLKVRIIQIEKNVQLKVRDIQPQFKTMHNITEEKIKAAHELLDRKARENAGNGSIPNGDDIRPISPEIVNINTEDEIKSQTSDDVPPQTPPAQSPTENKRNSLLLRLSKLTSPKRDSKSAENNETIAEVHKSPEEHKSPDETRKSIMKYGVPVLPSPTTNVPRLVSFNTPDDFESTLYKHEKRLKIIKQDIANLEIRISEFVGKKNGKHYNNLKDSLTQLIAELEEIHEEELLDQVVMCHNYIKSCLDFLETKSVDSEDVDDDVFANYTNSEIYGSTHDLLEGHNVRTTAI